MLRAALAVLVLAGLMGLPAGPARATRGQRLTSPGFWPTLSDDGAGIRPALSPRLLLQEQPAPVYVPPTTAVAPVAPENQSITDRWWFWAAVGGVVAATLVVILIAGRGPSAPSSTLGNMDAFGGK
jgi:hypothetical protein